MLAEASRHCPEQSENDWHVTVRATTLADADRVTPP
jgi:hypothetical protein